MDKLDKIFIDWGIRDEGYEKNLCDPYEIVSTYGDFPSACAHARRMRARYDGGQPPSSCDPCTTVDLLVGELKGLCERD